MSNQLKQVNTLFTTPVDRQSFPSHSESNNFRQLKLKLMLSIVCDEKLLFQSYIFV